MVGREGLWEEVVDWLAGLRTASRLAFGPGGRLTADPLPGRGGRPWGRGRAGSGQPGCAASTEYGPAFGWACALLGASLFFVQLTAKQELLWTRGIRLFN